MDEMAFKSARVHASRHRDQIERSESAGCFHCEVTFPASAISEWIDEAETALCPVCGTDSVIGDASGVPVLEAPFMAAMHGFWFKRAATA